MSRWNVRVRLFLGNHILSVIVVLLVLALVGGFLTYSTHVDPGTETERVEESSWSSTSQYTHQATVTAGTPVFDRGEVLRNRASYLTAATPVLNGTFVYEYRATDGGELQVTTEQVLVLRSVTETEEGETIEYWRLEESLGSGSAESVTPADTVRVPFSMNVSRAVLRIEAIEERLGDTPGETEIVVRSDVRISGTRNGAEVNQVRSYRMRIAAGGSVYSVEGTEPETDSGQQFRERTVEATYGPLRTVGSPLVLLLGLLGCLGLAAGHYTRTFTVTDAERAWLKFTSVHEEFDDWISTGEIPGEVLDRPRVSIETLDGLVDVAIDSNRRVLEDRDRGVCVVILDDVVYSYEIPPAVLSGERDDPLAIPPEPPANGDDTSQNGDEDATTTADDETTSTDDDETTTPDEDEAAAADDEETETADETGDVE